MTYTRSHIDTESLQTRQIFGLVAARAGLDAGRLHIAVLTRSTWTLALGDGHGIIRQEKSKLRLRFT